jgi:hypothetical protein
MPKAFDSWNVLPHRSLQEHAENLWSVEGELPGMALLRRMTLVRRANGGLVIHNPIALEEELMTKIEGWGKPELVVVPNGWHRLDCAVYKRRYPDAKIVCPAGSRKHVEKVVAVDVSYSDVGADDVVSFEHLDGTREAEGVMRALSSDGTTLVFNDAFFNVPHMSGMMGLVMRAIGSTGGPKVTGTARLILVKDKKALRAHLERFALAEPRRIIPGHGEIIEGAAGEVLRQVAGSL